MGIFVDIIGKGSIISNPYDIDYNYAFEEACLYKTDFLLHSSYVFSGWGGQEACSDGKLFMVSNKYCVAYFELLE